MPRVWLLGRPRVEDAAGQPYPPPRGQKALALLARVALAERPLTRGELAAELFGEADDPLGALRWCLADLRRCCQDPGLLRGDPVSLADGCPWVDVRALWDGSLPAAEIGGTLLQGVEPRRCPAFDVWLMLARGRCAARSMEELRRAALGLLATGDAEAATGPAGRAVALDPLDEGAQELFLRALVAAGHPARAAVHLSSCQAVFEREGLLCSPALRSAALPAAAAPAGLRAGVVARSLLRAGKAALDAGSADAGVETLRRAAEEAGHARDPLVLADVLAALGSALVHAVRGLDGEGAVVLNRALVAARSAGSQRLTAEILRELAFVDVQAGRHASATRALHEAWPQVEAAAERSIDICDRERWNAFVPWPQALRAHCLAAAGRCDRLPDRYVWVSGFVGLGHLEIAARLQPDLVMPLARRLYQDALRADLPEFTAWALIYQAEAGDLANLPLARTLAASIVNPALRTRAAALEDPCT